MQLTHFCSVTAAIFHFLPRFHQTGTQKAGAQWPACTQTQARMHAAHTLGLGRIASPQVTSGKKISAGAAG